LASTDSNIFYRHAKGLAQTTLGLGLKRQGDNNARFALTAGREKSCERQSAFTV